MNTTAYWLPVWGFGNWITSTPTQSNGPEIGMGTSGCLSAHRKRLDAHIYYAQAKKIFPYL